MSQKIATVLMAAVSLVLVVMAFNRGLDYNCIEVIETTHPIIVEGHVDRVTVEEVEQPVVEECTTPYENINQEMMIPCVWGNFDLTLDEFYFLCTTVFCEAGNQDIQCQIMTCMTILNRIYSDEFPNTVREVVYQEGAYEVTHWRDFEQKGWTEQVEMAVTYALESNEYPPTMYWFRTDHFHTFATPYMQCGAHYFSYKE